MTAVLWTVEYFPPGREDEHIYFCPQKPEFVLVDEPSGSMHTLMVRFRPTNGTSKGRLCTIPAAHCIVGEETAPESRKVGA